jgi:large subunit ribosomal protein L16
MLMPSRVKYRKSHRGRLKGRTKGGGFVSFGEFGSSGVGVPLDHGAADRSHADHVVPDVEKGGKVWTRIFPDKPVSKKPAETRMGKGKGNAEFWVAVVKPGRILFEIEGVTADQAKEAMRSGGPQVADRHAPCGAGPFLGRLPWPRKKTMLNFRN